MTRLCWTSRPAFAAARLPVRLMVSNANCSSARSRAVGVTTDGDGDRAGDCSTTVTTTAATSAAAMPSSQGPRCCTTAARRARALPASGSSAAPRPATSRLIAQSAASSGSRGALRLSSSACSRSRSRSNGSGDLCIGFLLETVPQLAARPERVDLDLVLRQRERGRHRGDIELLDIAKYQQRTGRLRHVGQRGAQFAGPLVAVERIAGPLVVGRPLRLVLACHQLQQAARSRPAAENVQAGVSRTGNQPWKLLARVQAVDVAPELDQRFLGHVLGLVVAAQHQAGQLVEPAAVLVDELFETTLHTRIYAGRGGRLQRSDNFFDKPGRGTRLEAPQTRPRRRKSGGGANLNCARPSCPATGISDLGEEAWRNRWGGRRLRGGRQTQTHAAPRGIAHGRGAPGRTGAFEQSGVDTSVRTFGTTMRWRSWFRCSGCALAF